MTEVVEIPKYRISSQFIGRSNGHKHVKIENLCTNSKLFVVVGRHAESMQLENCFEHSLAMFEPAFAWHVPLLVKK